MYLRLTRGLDKDKEYKTDRQGSDGSLGERSSLHWRGRRLNRRRGRRGTRWVTADLRLVKLSYVKSVSDETGHEQETPDKIVVTIISITRFSLFVVVFWTVKKRLFEVDRSILPETYRIISDFSNCPDT